MSFPLVILSLLSLAGACFVWAVRQERQYRRPWRHTDDTKAVNLRAYRALEARLRNRRSEQNSGEAA